MKKLILSINLIVLVTAAWGQTNVKDSLWKQFSTTKDDTTKVLLLAKLGDIYSTPVSPDSAFMFSQQGLKLAESIGYVKGEMVSKISIARVAQVLGDFETTIKLGYDVLSYANASNDSSLLIDVFAVLGQGYQTQGDFKEAMRWVLKSLDIEKLNPDCTFCAVFNASVGHCFYGMGKYDSSEVYLKKALSFPQPWGFGWISLLMGQTQEKLNNYSAAFKYYHQSIADLRAQINSQDLPGDYTSIAGLYLKTGNIDSSIFYAKQSLNYAVTRHFNKEAMDACLVLSAAYEKTNSTEALRYYKLATNAKDSLYSAEKQNRVVSYKFNDELRQQEIKAENLRLKNSIRTYILLGIVGLFIIFMAALIRNNRQKQKSKTKIEKAYTDLKSTQAQLIQSEKMASLGELTAGIAHEIQNPLNFVNNFSEVNKELLNELKDEIKKGNMDEVNAIADDVISNEEKISHHGKRADAIVKGMLQHSRSGSSTKEPTDINALCDEYLRLAYHGLRAKDKSFNATMKTDFDQSIGNITIIPQDIGRVLLNLYTNAFYAVNEKLKSKNEKYEPVLSVSTRKLADKIEITVADNGNGIPQQVVDKIFQPFFTTKPTGQGTGLGLSLSYDIVKAHGGEIKVESKEGEGSSFIIRLPIS